MPMDEFVGTKQEESVMTRLYDINKLLGRTLTLNFWYERSKKIVTAEVVRRFINQWDSILPFKTNINPHLTNSPHEFIWFNIVHKDDYKLKFWSRFDYVYTGHGPECMMMGIESFKNTALFCLKPKPKQRAKRSD